MEVHKDVDRVDTHAPLEALGEQGLMFDDWAGVKEESSQILEMVPLLKIVGEKPGRFSGCGDGDSGAEHDGAVL